MSDLPELMVNAVAKQSRDNKAALLLSGGLDSITVGLALEKAGKAVHAYTFQVEGSRSKDVSKAIEAARHIGWPLTIITVPRGNIVKDFLRLAVEQGCRKKVQFENTFPLLYILPQVAEPEVWTGWNADSHYGNDKNTILTQKRMAREGLLREHRKEAFDIERRRYFEHEIASENSAETWRYANQLAAQHGKRLMDPYLDRAIVDHFLHFDHEQLSPLTKPIVRKAFANDLRRLPRGCIAVGVRLQTGSGVVALFETLLARSAINRFEKKYADVSSLCQRWSREVQRHPAQFHAELAGHTPIPPPPPKVIRWKSGQYQPYLMANVALACAQPKFTVVSTFSGGGGSDIGVHLAGGEILLANEFVPEAARTYAKNLLGVPIDQRDIRDVVASFTTIRHCLARRGGVDLVIGSAPCCELSTSGPGISDQDQLRRYSDTKQKGMATLLFDFFEFAKLVHPKVVISENVPNLASRNNADLFLSALDSLRYTGAGRQREYYVSSAVLSAADYGVAQERKRLIMIGVERQVAEAVGIKSDADILPLFPLPTHMPTSIRSAFANLRQTADDIRPWRRAMMTNALGRIVSRLPKNPPSRIKPHHVGFERGSHFTLIRCAWDLPAPTLTVMGQRPDGLSGSVHPSEDRKFSIPELKRLMGLPDDYLLTGTLAQAAERICRMVPPPLMRAVATSIYEKVLLPYREKSHDRR